MREEDDKMKIKERWVVTELKDEKNPDKVYYVSDIGRIMTKDLNRKEKWKVELDPAKSKVKNSKGIRSTLGGRLVSVRKLVYHSFNKIPLDERRTIVSKDGNLFNVRLDNLEDRSKRNRILDRIDLGCLECKDSFRWGLKNELWIEMDFYNSKSKYIKYYVSNQGRIGKRHTKKDKGIVIIIDNSEGNFTISPHGYVRVHLGGRQGSMFYVHRLVAGYFEGVPYTSYKHVHHKNSLRHDNRLENLMWVTPKEHRLIETGKIKID